MVPFVSTNAWLTSLNPDDLRKVAEEVLDAYFALGVVPVAKLLIGPARSIKPRTRGSILAPRRD